MRFTTRAVRADILCDEESRKAAAECLKLTLYSDTPEGGNCFLYRLLGDNENYLIRKMGHEQIVWLT